MIDTSKDLPIAWSGGQSGEYIIVYFGYDLGPSVGCSFDSALQTAVVPKEALAPFAGVQQGQVSVHATALMRAMAGSTSVEFEVSTTERRMPATYK